MKEVNLEPLKIELFRCCDYEKSITDALQKIEDYFNALEKKSNGLLRNTDLQNLMSLQEKILLEVKIYTDISKSDVHKEIVEHHAAQGNENYKWGEKVKQRLANYQEAAKIVNSLLTDNENAKSKLDFNPKYYSCEDSVLLNIFNISTEIFSCDRDTFCKFIHCGDLSTIMMNEGSKTRFKYVIFILSKYIGDDWYTNVCLSLKITKSECSKPYDKTSHKKWGSKIKKLIPEELFSNPKQS